jgi:isopenicillin-N N-acyltransferase-like protein
LSAEPPAPTDAPRRKRRRWPWILGAIALLALGARVWFLRAVDMQPPGDGAHSYDGPKMTASGPLRRADAAWLRRRGHIWELGLPSGASYEGGWQLSALMRDRMIADEAELYGAFEKAVPFAPARWLIMGAGELRFRHVDRGIAERYRYELEGIATGLAPDPFTGVMPSYRRLVFLYSVYDIALSFEHSPLIGCTTFESSGDETVSDPSSKDWNEATAGHTFLARAFDFEAGDVFDKDKVVSLVREPGKIPFLSVGWPGFIGVVSGMNREGVALVVHGGRAGTPRAEGTPVVYSLREALASARTTEEAVAILSSQEVMVSHIVIVSDAHGDHAVVERAPGAPAFVRRSRGKLATTNHFEGPLAGDPRDREVRAHTTTLARRTRADALLGAAPKRPGVADMVAMLRDRRGPDGASIALGDRRAVDALIATHGVVFDTTARDAWVSESPHLLGRFVRFPLRKLLSDDYDPARDPVPTSDAEIDAVPADPLLTSGDPALAQHGIHPEPSMSSATP